MKGQRGAILIVSLIMLTILTLIGVTSMDDVNLQRNMVRNNQLKIQAFDMAMSEINAQIFNLITDMNFMVDAINTPGGVNVVAALMAAADNPFDQTVSVSYTGEGRPPSGYSLDDYTGRMFQIDSAALLANTGSTSDQTQGLNYAGPK